MWLNEKTTCLKSIEATAFTEHSDLKIWVAIETVENQYHTVEALQMWTQNSDTSALKFQLSHLTAGGFCTIIEPQLFCICIFKGGDNDSTQFTKF